jgi:hypothetical protein
MNLMENFKIENIDIELGFIDINASAEIVDIFGFGFSVGELSLDIYLNDTDGACSLFSHYPPDQNYHLTHIEDVRDIILSIPHRGRGTLYMNIHLEGIVEVVYRLLDEMAKGEVTFSIRGKMNLIVEDFCLPLSFEMENIKIEF